MRTFLRTALTAGLAAGLSLTAGVAHATPAGPGITAEILAQSTVGNTDYILREITIPPGQATGWHYHDGILYGFVRKGTLSHFDASCESDGVYRAGRTLTEPSGVNHVHIGRNLGKDNVVLDVLYVLPHSAPLSEDASNPGCDFQ
ncbi:cupin domain-containing protein [Streptomyces sp. NPDC088354]|uniref:cupin domain-containing protein n=1 Tax=Streptomyces sp. NPDC088354 TaxID=3365856 RepID=UPI003827FAA3